MTDRLNTAIQALKNGELVILVDSEDRENEGDLVLAAQFATPEKINFLIRKACGLVCLALESKKIDQLALPQMVQENQTTRKTAFTVSIEAAKGVSTGISAQDRAHTIQVAADPNSTRVDLVSPGHIFPLRAAPGGVLERAGHTEGSIELCKMAGLIPAAVICEIINEDGTMARKEDLKEFSTRYQIPIVTIEEIIANRTVSEEWMDATRPASFPVEFATGVHKNWKIQGFRNQITQQEHVAISTSTQDKFNGKIPLVRIHSECLTGDVLGSLRCDCGQQLHHAIQMISDDPQGGTVVYLKNQEGRGIGLWNKIEAYALQDAGRDTLDANLDLGFHPDLRKYHEAAKILLTLGLTRIRLLTNSPKKLKELEQFGIEVVERVPIQMPLHVHNERYLQTKRERFQHFIEGNP